MENICQSCGKSFKKAGKLNRHIREIHENLKPFKCEVCNKEFKRNSHLKRHMVCHSSNPKPFACRIDNCIQRFSNKHHLDRHVKIVHDQDRFRCKFCDLLFNKKKQLQKHFTTAHENSTEHEIEKLNATDDVSKCFDNKPVYNDLPQKKLKREESLDMIYEDSKEEFKHSKQDIFSEDDFLGLNTKNQKIEESRTPSLKEKKSVYVCFYESCLKAFTTRYNLQVHIKSFHMKIKPFICNQPGCNTRFSHKASMKRHCVKMHSMNLETPIEIDSSELSGNNAELKKVDLDPKEDDLSIIFDDSEQLRDNLSIKFVEFDDF